MTVSLRQRIEAVRERLERRGVGYALRLALFSRVLNLMRLLPHGPRIDRTYALLDFVRKNGRLPTGRMLLNDVLYRSKVDGDLASELRVRTTDKELVKSYVAEKVGDRYNVPTLAILRSEQEIRTFDFPERCAIKPTHATARAILRREGEPIDLDAVVAWLGHDQYHASREPNYRGLEPKIIVEPLLEYDRELCLFCYGGEVRIHAHRLERPAPLHGPGWTPLPMSISRPLDRPLPEQPPPARLEELERVAGALAGGFGLIRVDVYVGLEDGAFAIGELTHSHASAGQPFVSRDQEARFGRLLFGEGTPHAHGDQAAERGASPAGDASGGVRTRATWGLAKRSGARVVAAARNLRERIRLHGPLRALRYMGVGMLLGIVRRGPEARWVDRVYAALHFVQRNGRLPRNRPLFNDVLHRYKIDGELEDPLRRATTDKASAKTFVAERVGEEHAVPTLAVLRSEAEVRAFDYPERCAIKPTHSSGRSILRSAGEPIDVDHVASWLRHDLYRLNRERHYRGLEHAVIVEPLLEYDVELAVFCFEGEVRLHGVVEKPYRLFGPGWIDLQDTFDSPDRAWRPHPKPLPPMAAPQRLGEIERIAAELARGFSLVRIDLYLIGERILVGELTHCHGSAGHRFHDREQEVRLSQRLFGPSV